MKKIAITGKIAAGKSSAAQIIKRKGYPVFNADQYVHLAYLPSSPIYDELINIFGMDIVDDFKHIDHQKLAHIIFNYPIKKKLLENLVHPIVKKGLITFFNKQKDNDLVFAEIPLLYQVGWQDMFDHILIIDASKETIKERLKQKRDYDDMETDMRYSAQITSLPHNEKTTWISNDTDLISLQRQINCWLREYRRDNHAY